MTFTASTVTAKRPGGKLSKDEAALLAKAKASGDKTVTLLIATAPGQAKTVAGGLARASERPFGTATSSSAMSALMFRPTRSRRRSQLPGIEAADVDQIIPMPDPRPAAGGLDCRDTTAPGGVNPARATRTCRSQ